MPVNSDVIDTLLQSITVSTLNVSL